MSRINSREAKRAHILDAAERLLRADHTADFSMRELASEAAVSFATPFNSFGSKTAIMHALSARRIDAMFARVAASAQEDDAISRVLTAFDIAVAVLLEEPAVNRQVIGSLGSPTTEPGRVADHSRALWTAALGDCTGIRADLRNMAAVSLPTHLAIGFRGCISFWVAGEIADQDLHDHARSVAAALLLGFAHPDTRHRLMAMLIAAPQAPAPRMTPASEKQT